LGADIKVTLENMSQQDAEKFVEQAHQFCPYSKATRGNIDVQIDVTAQ
ncbi:MAG: OsmC family protein, partial [Staphylococcus epidermidis]|nr:OsmC family protein [Staphylococcus epidermidis]